MMLWGLVPHFAKDDHNKYKTINARDETVEELPTSTIRFIVPVVLFLSQAFMNQTRFIFQNNLSLGTILR